MENFDYSSSGAYFITLCSKNREPLFRTDESLREVGVIMLFERVKNLREDRDIKQKQMAEYLQVHQTTYSDYELGHLNTC